MTATTSSSSSSSLRSSLSSFSPSHSHSSSSSSTSTVLGHRQLTPRPSSSTNNATAADEHNPFDSLAAPHTGGPTAAGAGTSANTVSPARTHSRGNSANSGAPVFTSGTHTPSGLLTPGGITSHAGLPTTSLSLTDPDFTMKLPPAKATAAASSAAAAAAAAAAGGGGGGQGGATRNTHGVRGHLTIKLISARNLRIASPHASPYAVVSFDKNEFVSREPTDEDTSDAKGDAVPVSAQSRVRTKTIIHPASAPLDPNSALSTSGLPPGAAGADPGGGGGGGGQRASAALSNGTAPALPDEPAVAKLRNPVWKHEVTFDVTQEKCPIFISVYDRNADGESEEGFLGSRELRPRLVNHMSSDEWYPLSIEQLVESGKEEVEATSLSPLPAGEIRIQISYERTPAKKLTPSDFEYLKLIGRGTFGRVFQVRKKDTKRIYAMKVLSKREIAAKQEVTHTMGERKILEKSLDCPFLVGLKFSFQSEQELFFVTDYKSGGELFWHLQREGRFLEDRARFYVAELVLALEHLHKYDIVYRDLKPENILLDATGHVALCDFGLSKPDLGAGQLTNTFCGTTEYLAPEVLLDESGYSKLVDFWSLGVLLFEMCCGWSPFYAEDTQQMYRNICFGKIKFPRGAIGDDGKQFVKGLLNRNPKHRLGAQRDAQDLKEHPFFKEIDWEALAAKRVTPPFKPLVESDESTANFDPEFTETNISEVAVIPDFDGIEGAEDETMLAGGGAGSGLGADGAGGAGAGGAGGAGSNGRRSNQGAGASAMAIQRRRDANGDDEDDDSPLTRSVQEKFRGFSYSGTYEGSTAGSFGGRRGSGFGLAGGGAGFAFQMSKMDVGEDGADARSIQSTESGSGGGGGRRTGAGDEVEMNA
ncbi:Serine/threonine-protein kinase [Tilletia horrida]|nr:Serine/threonine-protein kinase [Tilletia horrida]